MYEVIRTPRPGPHRSPARAPEFVRQLLVPPAFLGAERRRDDRERALEVGPCHHDLPGPGVDLVGGLTGSGRGQEIVQSEHARLPADRGDVASHVVCGLARQPVQVHVVGQGHSPRVYCEDGTARRLVGRRHEDPLLEATRPQHRGIEDVGAIRRADDDHVRE